MAASRCGTLEPLRTWPQLLSTFLASIDASGLSYSSRRAYATDCGDFVEFIMSDDHAPPQELDSQQVEAWLTSLSDLAPASLERKLSSVRRFLQFVRQEGVLADDPTAGVLTPTGRPARDVPSASDCWHLLEARESLTELAAIALLVFAGLTRSELLRLNLDDVAADLTALKIRNDDAKERIIPVCDDLRLILRAYIAARTGDGSALLLNQAGNRMEPTTFHRLFRRVVKRAGLENAGITPMSLREAFAQMLVGAGADVVTVADLLGVGREQAGGYFGASPLDPRQVIDRLNADLRGTPEVDHAHVAPEPDRAPP